MAPSPDLLLGLIVLFFLQAVLLGYVLFFIFPFRLFVRAKAAGIPVQISDLVGMRLRGTPPRTILSAAITLAGYDILLPLAELEAHVLAGGNLQNVCLALMAAREATLPLDFKQACAIDLAGRDPFKAVKDCLEPSVLTTKPFGAQTKNGRKVLLTARLTLRGNIRHLIGGSPLEVIEARVMDHILTAIQNSSDDRVFLGDLDSMAKGVLEAGLDQNGAWQLLAIEVHPA